MVKDIKVACKSTDRQHIGQPDWIFDLPKACESGNPMTIYAPFYF